LNALTSNNTIIYQPLNKHNMKTNKTGSALNIFLILAFMLFLASCKKENSAQDSAATTTSVAASEAVAVGVSPDSNDSIYVIGTCAHNHHLDSISITSLPAIITDYLAGNYAGYTFQKAYTDNDSSGSISGYVVIIQFNGKPVGLKFDASGNFIRVLEQREGHDLSGKGWHPGGCFDDRDGRHRDTVALASLPSAILSYVTENYPLDTLIRAYKNRDGSYIIFSRDNGAFATVFSANGSFISRDELQTHAGNLGVIDQGDLPAAIQTYLSSTYPDYVFNEAFSFSQDGVLLGYVIGLDANGTKYAVEFDASGDFVKAITIR
jgi:hypothetical protein